MKNPWVPIEWEAGEVPELVWMLWSREILPLTGIEP
jgi:hypothetical protein